MKSRYNKKSRYKKQFAADQQISYIEILLYSECFNSLPLPSHRHPLAPRVLPHHKIEQVPEHQDPEAPEPAQEEVEIAETVTDGRALVIQE